MVDHWGHMMLADFHVHSTFSDGRLPLKNVVDFYGRLGFGAIAITDHVCEEATFLGKMARTLDQTLSQKTFQKYLSSCQEQAERAWKKYRMVVIPGVELSKNYISHQRSAHILGIGVQDWVSADPAPAEICRRIRAQGGLAIAAHPVSTRKVEKQTLHLWDHREELRYSFDAWEVASGPHIFPEVLHSGLPMIASSDLHHPRQINAWKTVLECERHPEAILQAIRLQELSLHFFTISESQVREGLGALSCSRDALFAV